jgi:hypothetical protein
MTLLHILGTEIFCYHNIRRNLSVNLPSGTMTTKCYNLFHAIFGTLNYCRIKVYGIISKLLGDKSETKF